MKKILLTVLISAQTILVSAQWEFTNGPYGGLFNEIAQDSSGNLYALGWGYSNRSLYKSTNMGESWHYIANGKFSGLMKWLWYPMVQLFLQRKRNFSGQLMKEKVGMLLKNLQ